MEAKKGDGLRSHPYRRKLRDFERIARRAVEDHASVLFACDACRNVLKNPVTVTCGHTFCEGCLALGRCPVCSADFRPDGGKINVLVQALIDKWRETNKTSDLDAPTVNLVLHPRYELRSGYAGLQYTVDIRRPKMERPKNGDMAQVTGIPRKQMYARIRRKPNNGNEKTLERFFKENYQDLTAFSSLLDDMLAELESTVEKALRHSWDCISPEDLECLLCRECLRDPVTTPCGHTFCRDCLMRVLDHRLTCPLCVSKLTVSDYFLTTTKVLDEAVRLLFPIETSLSNPNSGNPLEKGVDVPVFVCTNAFPGVACPLYVLEPRYRLLVRRCLQSHVKRFAMVSADARSTKLGQYGTILEVRDAVTLEDGRIILSTEGFRRCKILNKSEKDGYDVANIEYISDQAPEPDQQAHLAALHRKVYNRAVKWIRLLSPAALFEVERLIGKMPKVEKDWMSLPDGPAWAWWLIPIFPLSSQLQIGFLSSTSLEKRLRAIDKMLEHMKIKMRAAPRDETVTYSRQDESVAFCSEGAH